MKKYDVAIVGAGPAGIFTAIEMIKKGSKKSIIIIEKGKSVEKRKCPKAVTGKCMNCKPYCHITTGFSGAGAFSDGKLSLSYEVGGNLPELIGEDLAQETINYTDKIYLEFGADTHIEGIGNTEEVKEIRKRAIQAGLKLVDCPIRHLGTEKAHDLYFDIEKYLIAQGVDIMFDSQCSDLILDGEKCLGVRLENGEEIYAADTVVATGRRGADWLEKLCADHGIAHQPGTVDIGVRVEVRNEIIEKSTMCFMNQSLWAIRSRLKTRCAHSAKIPAALWLRKITTTTLPLLTAIHIKSLKAKTQTWQFYALTIFRCRLISRLHMRKRLASLPICSATAIFLCSASAIFLRANALGKRSFRKATCAPLFPMRLQETLRRQCLIVQ